MPRATSWRSTIRSRSSAGSAIAGLLDNARSHPRAGSGHRERSLDGIDRLVGEVLGNLAHDAACQFLVAVLADLAERLGIGGDDDLADAAAQGLGVEPFGDRCAVGQL